MQINGKGPGLVLGTTPFYPFNIGGSLFLSFSLSHSHVLIHGQGSQAETGGESGGRCSPTGLFCVMSLLFSFNLNALGQVVSNCLQHIALCPWDSPDKNTESVAMPSSKGSPRSLDQTYVSYVPCIDGCVLYH